MVLSKQLASGENCASCFSKDAIISSNSSKASHWSAKRIVTSPQDRTLPPPKERTLLSQQDSAVKSRPTGADMGSSDFKLAQLRGIVCNSCAAAVLLSRHFGVSRCFD